MSLLNPEHKFRVLFKYEHGYNYLMEDTAYLISGSCKYKGSKLFMRRPKEIRIDPNYPHSVHEAAEALYKKMTQVCHPHGTVAFGIGKEDLAKIAIGMPGWATGTGSQFRPQRHKWEAEHGWRKFDSTV